MKKQVLFAGMVVFPALVFLATQKNSGNQTGEKYKEAFSVTSSGWDQQVKTNLTPETELKTGRHLTYFWEEHAETQL